MTVVNGNPVDTQSTEGVALDDKATADAAAKAAADKAAADAAAAAQEPTTEQKDAAEKAAADAAAAEAEAAAKAKPLDKDVWGTTGDDVGDSVLALLQNSGVSTDEAKALMFDAMQAGDVTKVDVAALTAKVGKATATLILAGAENFVARRTARANTIVAEVHSTVGGKDNWGAITAWAASGKVPEADLAAYRTMIDAGGAQARFAATELATRYNADSSNTTLPSESGEIIGDNKASKGSRQTTKQEYYAELDKAHKAGASEAVINEINAARARGRKAGI